MATESLVTATTVSADCGDPGAEIKPDIKPDVTRLCVFAAPLSPTEAFSRTAEYAKDPKAYLIDLLGQDTFDERRHLLSIPEVVDKDVYGDGQHKSHFESHIAGLFGKKYGLFFHTGVQAQLAALKIHCEEVGRSRVAWHVSCHLESAEEKAYDALYCLDRTLIGEDMNSSPTVSEIKQVLEVDEEARPGVVVLEVPNRVLGCATYTFDELREISSACKAAGVKLHCDGARLWEIEPYYRSKYCKSFADLAELFDTVYVSFCKWLSS
jgi:threonine aldolase